MQYNVSRVQVKIISLVVTLSAYKCGQFGNDSIIAAAHQLTNILIIESSKMLSSKP